MPGLSLGDLSSQLGGCCTAAAACSDPLADAARAAPWRPPEDGRTEIQRLRALLENGVGRSFDLRGWCERDSCALGASARLELLLEQCRPEVAKLIVMEQLEADGREDTEELTYGEITNEAFLQLLRRHAAGEPIVGSRRVFYDLGSGTGKTVLLAAASGYFTAAKGIELLPCVGAIGTALAEEFTAAILPDLAAPSPAESSPSRPGGSLACGNVALTVGDMFVDTSWVEAVRPEYRFLHLFEQSASMRNNVLGFAAAGLRLHLHDYVWPAAHASNGSNCRRYAAGGNIRHRHDSAPIRVLGNHMRGGT